MSVPSIKEELERKTLEAIESLVVRHRNGDLSDKEFSTGLATAYDCVAGLVDKSITEFIEMAYIEER